MMKDEFSLFKASQEKDILANESAKYTVLIVDDDINVRDALEHTLKRSYNLILCADGNEGIEKMNLTVSVVILDIKMEGKNGFETFIEIKKKNPIVPIVFHSAYQDLMNPFEIMNDYRPFGYVIKEGDGKELKHTVESAIDYFKQINKNAELIMQLQIKNTRLQEFQNSLESLVEIRTKELTKANADLHREIRIRQHAENENKTLLAEKEIILKEVHHRIKNNMNTLGALFSLQIADLHEASAISALEDAKNRVQSMMILYDKLYLSANFEKISVEKYLPPLINQIIKNFPHSSSVKVKIRIDDIILDAGRLQPLGILINELLTNIMKYAFIDKEDGLIIVEATSKSIPNSDDKLFSIFVQDNGQGFPDLNELENSAGFGLKLVKMLTQQLKGVLQMRQENGIRFTLEFKI